MTKKISYLLFLLFSTFFAVILHPSAVAKGSPTKWYVPLNPTDNVPNTPAEKKTGGTKFYVPYPTDDVPNPPGNNEEGMGVSTKLNRLSKSWAFPVVEGGLKCRLVRTSVLEKYGLTESNSDSNRAKGTKHGSRNKNFLEILKSLTKSESAKRNPHIQKLPEVYTAILNTLDKVEQASSEGKMDGLKISETDADKTFEIKYNSEKLELSFFETESAETAKQPQNIQEKAIEENSFPEAIDDIFALILKDVVDHRIQEHCSQRKSQKKKKLFKFGRQRN